MKIRFKKLLEALELNENPVFSDGNLHKILVDPAKKSWLFELEFPAPLEIKDFEELMNNINQIPSKFKEVKSTQVQIKYNTSNFDLLPEYYDYVLQKLIQHRPRFSAMSDFEIEHNNNRLHVVCPKDGQFVTKMLKMVNKELHLIGFDVVLATRICDQQPSIKDKIDQQSENFTNKISKNTYAKSFEKKFVSYSKKRIRGEMATVDTVPKTENDLSEYKSMNNDATFQVEGIITKIDSIDIRNNTTLYTFIISSDNDSVYAKKFSKQQSEKDFFNDTKVGMIARVKGNAAYDNFSKEVTITAYQFERTTMVKPTDIRQDTADKKRVELHLHTKMSTLDGINSIDEYVETAMKWGHDAIAVTDHGTTQSYPDFFHATHKKNILPIYGAEFSFIDEDELKIVQNELDLSITDAVFTVFDIETTGLSVNFDKIIEISAVKLKNNQIIDRFNTFINPEQSLSRLTTKLTSITNKDVAVAPKIKEAIYDFKDFFEGSIMVAHNAHFDMGFIYKALKEFDLYSQEITTIDTLQIARNCFGNELKRFNLKAVSKFFKVHLERHHRAIYDTKATAEIFLHMLSYIRQQGIKNIKDINMLSDRGEAYKHAISKHINLLVRNKTGLKNIYELTSLANTTYFAKEPRLLKSVLDNYKEGLLIGSGCVNSAFFEKALNKSYEETKAFAAYFDYLEVQPLRDFYYKKDTMDTIEKRYIDTIHRIIQIGDELGIPVVATSDAHHINKKTSKLRDIYIQTPVVGGGLHPLARYDEIPSQYLRTTNEMLAEFHFLDDDIKQEIVVENTNFIASKIESFTLFEPTLHAPNDDFFALDGIPSIENKLIQMVHNKSKEIYGAKLPQIVEERTQKEIKSITKNKFSSVYYISHLLVKKSLDEGYLVGSRGSVGSSLVATMMDITEVNPLPPHYVCPKCHFSSFKMTEEEKTTYGIKEAEERLQVILNKVSSGFDLPKRHCPECDADLIRDGHDIPFETFLGFKGDKVPDIDLNFSGDYQPIVHEYIRELFGEERAFRAGTISTVADKTAFGYVKGYLEKKDITMRNAEIERRASQITGVKRTTGQHPGGIVVVPTYKEITDITPIQYPSDDTTSNWKTTHFDYHSFEDNLFKLDVLGHDDPTMIKFLMDYVRNHPIDFPFTDARDIPLDDENVYALLSSTESIGLTKEDINSDVASFGIPEMGTPFVRDMLKESHPKTFAEAVKISGLSHGTDVWLNNAKELVTGQSNFGTIPFNQVIGCRDDIMIYLIQNGMDEAIAFEISEFIRKGKAEKQRDKWQGYKQVMSSHGVPDWYIWSCGQIKYMFPKAHATAYVMMAMRIAWFKVHKPILFYSAFFSKRVSDYDVYAFKGGEQTIRKRMQEIDDEGPAATDKDLRLYTVLEVALEMVKRGYRFDGINLQQSKAKEFIISEDEKGLIMPFITVDGLGLKVANSIINARNEKEFKSKDDIKERTNVSKTLFDKLDMLDVFEGLPDNSQINLFEM